MAQLEIACFTAAAAVTAWTAGADRIELCRERSLGGTTPSLDTLKHVKPHVSIPVFVMIRPRGGDFEYSDAEFAQMKNDIELYKPLADGFVFGLLDERKRVDVARSAELVQAAHPRSCTYHRAFDEATDKAQALEDVVRAGCHSILTSGGAIDALQGSDVLTDLVQKANGRVDIIAGGGVRAVNVQAIKEKTRALIFHSSAVLGEQDEPDEVEIKDLLKAIREPGSKASSASI